MKENKNLFISQKNIISQISDKEFLQLENYLEVIKAFSRVSYESIYVIDYKEMTFEYVSDNPLFLCGNSADDVKSLGYDFYLKYVPETDLELLKVINEEGFIFFDKLPIDENRKSYTISYDFHLMHNNNPILINHKLTPIFLTECGKIWKAICVVSLSNKKASGNIAIYKQGSEDVWKFDIKQHHWYLDKLAKLSQKEKDILRLFAQEFTIAQIAEKLCIAPDTVKYYRRKIFENFDVNNITEALFFAMNNKLI